MKLTKEALKGLRKMIETTSLKVLTKYNYDNKTSSINYDTVFIGDSMIEYLKLDKYLPELHALNRGIAGATTKLVLENFHIILGNFIPKTVYVSIGSNDLVLLESSIEEAFKGVVNVFNKIKETYPGVYINYLSTTPVVSEEHKLYKKIYIGGRTNGQLKSLNFKVMSYCQDNDVHYIHQFDGLIDEAGYLKSEYTADGIHLNDKGYEIYTNTIKDHMKSKYTDLKLDTITA